MPAYSLFVYLTENIGKSLQRKTQILTFRLNLEAIISLNVFFLIHYNLFDRQYFTKQI